MQLELPMVKNEASTTLGATAAICTNSVDHDVSDAVDVDRRLVGPAARSHNANRALPVLCEGDRPANCARSWRHDGLLTLPRQQLDRIAGVDDNGGGGDRLQRYAFVRELLSLPVVAT
jgi:hypothetical protein